MTDNHWELTRINTNVNPGKFGRFSTFVAAVWCTACKEEMGYNGWPSHYRTKRHRLARIAERVR